MPTSATATAEASPSSPWTRRLLLLAVFSASALAVATAFGQSKAGVVLPLAVGAGLVLAVVAATRFQAYVMFLLVARSSLDLVKLSGRVSGAGGAPSASSRAIDPSSVLAVLFLVTAALWLSAQHRQHGGTPGSPVRRALLFFLAAAAASVVGSHNLVSSALEAMRICAVVMMFVVLEQIMRDARKMRQVLCAAFLSTLFPLAYTAFGFLRGHPPSEKKGSFLRIVGTFNQSNDFGRYLMLMIIMGAAIYPHLDRRWRRPLALLIVGMSGCLLLTYTRTALIATALGLLVVGLIQSKRLVAGLVIAGALSLLAVPSMASRFTDLTRTQARQGAAAGENTGNSLVWRLNYWTDVLPLANSNPITGIGLNMTRYSTDQERQPHNDFLRAYVEMGLAGLVAYVSMLVSLVRVGRRAVHVTPKGTLESGVGAGFLGCAVGFIAASAFANVISNVVNLWYFFAFAAAATAVAHHGVGVGGRARLAVPATTEAVSREAPPPPSSG